MTDEERKSIIIPFACPVCGMILRNDKNWWKFRCCNLCFVFFAENREERWLSGWRPSPEEIQVMKGSIS
jgi:hypothetical protein